MIRQLRRFAAAGLTAAILSFGMVSCSCGDCASSQSVPNSIAYKCGSCGKTTSSGPFEAAPSC